MHLHGRSALTDTAQYADYVLPAASFLERADIKLTRDAGMASDPHIEWSERVLPPRGEARRVADIIEDIARSAGVMPYSSPLLRALARAGLRISQERLLDIHQLVDEELIQADGRGQDSRCAHSP
jgi:anaerobic selenocysteine-containing dehydrogenase